MERTEKETTYQETRRVQKGDFAAAGQISASYKNMLKRLGVDSKVVRRLAIASYEAEINLAIHTLGGSMTIIVYPDHIFLVVEDTGPGIADIALAMQEGYSTAPEEVRMLGFGAGWGDGLTVLYLSECWLPLLGAVVFSAPVAPKLRAWANKRGWVALDLVYALLIAGVFLVSACFIIKGTYNPFIYFNF